MVVSTVISLLSTVSTLFLKLGHLHPVSEDPVPTRFLCFVQMLGG